MEREILQYLEPYDPGVFPAAVTARYGIPESRIANLASNETPYRLPRSVVNGLARSLAEVTRYPDPSYRRAKDAVAAYVRCSPKAVSVGNGAGEVLATLAAVTLESHARAIVPIPSYSLYLFVAMAQNASLELVQMDPPGFAFDVDRVIDQARDAALVLICSPNNPTGASVPAAAITRLHQETSAVIAVDEAYAEFSGRSVLPLVKTHPRLAVIRSCSKYFGLAGLRVGYVVADPGLIDRMERVRLPFNVNRPAVAALELVTRQRAWFAAQARRIVSDRKVLAAAVARDTRCVALPSDANFLLIKLPDGLSSVSVMDGLLSRGIIVRDVSGMPGLGDGYLRVTVGTPADNRRFARALAALPDTRKAGRSRR
ncbi:MAG: histidinol-phosphate transaminase [Nitrospirota bacterium]